MEERVFNFSPGPAALPLPVLEQVRRDLPVLPGAGASVLEISHRSARFREILDDAKERIVRLLGLPASHRVLFLPGGASLQFSMIAMNLLRGRDVGASFLLTGSWGRKARAEALREGRVDVAWSGEPEGFRRVPAPGEFAIDADAAYVHVTSNETIEGVQFGEIPDTGDVPLVCDASSDFLSRPIDASRFALIYAGAQKNVGPAGVTVVILREDLLDRVPEGLPRMLDYRRWVETDSLQNTAPVFAIYVVGLVARWIEEEVGGLAAMAGRNRRKAAAIYRALDETGGFYRGHADPASRSTMNVTFRIPGEGSEAAFLEEAARRGLVGLAGHRSVGGIRASLYNAMSQEGADALCALMTEFRETHENVG